MSCFFKQLFFLTLLTIVVQTRAAPLFDDNSVLDIEVIGPLGSLFASKKDRQEAPFILRANGADHDVKLRVRGKSRVRVCDFLPLRVNYSNDDTSESIFEGQDKLKLVSQCKKSKRSRLDTLEEFAAYRIFNLISEVSYKVRLLRVTYTDTDERINDKFVEQYGFLIESDVGLAERLGVESVESPGVTLRLLDENQAAAVFIFQYRV